MSSRTEGRDLFIQPSAEGGFHILTPDKITPIQSQFAYRSKLPTAKRNWKFNSCAFEALLTTKNAKQTQFRKRRNHAK